MENRIIQGNCLEELKTLADNSVDAVVTDPPYGLSFMGKKWDYDVPSVETWEECLRVLKPGGYLLAFAGTRTQHRMAVRIEDAGFEIRDMIAWVYGSGFPKSLNIGKAIDKLQGNERSVVGKDKSGGVRNSMAGNFIGGEYDITKGISPHEGWGTALKPALEPITVARKPLGEKTVAENVLKWGTGGINIEGSRVGTTDDISGTSSKTSIWGDGESKQVESNGNELGGRFPANLIHDGSDEIVELFPNDSQRFFYCAKASKSERNRGVEDGNKHPTIKPISLMEYLVKLVTKENAIVLDPFAGSGSTLLACKNLNRNYIGIEMEPEYIEIIKARLNNETHTKTE